MADVPVYNMADTWNDGGTTFTAIKMNVTDTASAAASLLYDLSVGGSLRLQVDKNGNVDIASGAGYEINGTSVLNATACDVTTSGTVTTGTIELGAATDTTLARSAAGVVSVEGVDLVDVDDLETANVNGQTGTTYTLALSDRGQIVTMSNASANTLTIPTNASVDFDPGTVITIIQIGAGVTTVTASSTVTLNGVASPSTGGAINNQYGGVSIVQLSANTWVMSGDVGTVT